MIENKTKIIIIQRLFFFIVGYLALSFILGKLLSSNYFINFYNYVFILFLLIDIVFTIILLIKDYGLLKLFIVIQNLLLICTYIVLSFAVVFSTVYVESFLTLLFVSVLFIGLISYPIFIMIFLVDTYKGVNISMNYSLFWILFNGLIIFLLSFLFQTEYNGIENHESLTNFDFEYWLGIIYFPVVIALGVYVVSLFKVTNEDVEE